MFGPKRSLRRRLTFGHTLIVFLAITIFAELAQNMLGYFQRDTVNARLVTSAAALALVAAHDAPGMRAETLHALASPQYDAAIVTAGGRVKLATAPVPAIVVSSAVRPPRIAQAWKVGAGDLQYRIGVVAVAGATTQSAVFWHRVDDGATDGDERVALVLFLAIPCVVSIAFAVGDRLTRLALEPLTELARVAATIEASDLSERIAPIPVDTELADVCATLNRMFARLESAFERQRRFTADASHEFRAPLSVITAEADLAVTGFDTEDEYRDSARAVLREAKRIERITEDLLTIARGEAGISECKEPVDVGIAVRNAITILQGAANKRSVQLETDIDADLWVAGNATSITRICVALLDNAIKFTDSGSRVLIRVSGESDFIRLALSDEGPGFSGDGLARAFERFWRDDAARGRTGTGLGLSIVQALVTGAQGTIVIENRSPRGCRVTVTIPALHSPRHANGKTRPMAQRFGLDAPRE